jgi:uroporphyrin-III C-methyltransferase/precorrin-2 dehydrogenase/sirohydrochlorin ferrochelatase
VFVSGHGVEQPEFDWNRLAQPEQTIVFYMALDRVATICRELRRHGLTDTTPAAVISHGTTRDQKVLNATLATLPDTVAEHPPESPALLIVGDVVSLHDRLKWFRPDSSTVIDEAGALKQDGPDPANTPAWLDSAAP